MIDLGRYAAPVLAAWGIGLVLLAGITVQSLLSNARVRRTLAEFEGRRG